MPVACPYCRYNVKVKNARPGKFTIPCPKCQKKFRLRVPEDPDQPMVGSPIVSEAEAPPAKTKPQAAEPPKRQAPQPPARPPAPDLEATAAPPTARETSVAPPPSTRGPSPKSATPVAAQASGAPPTKGDDLATLAPTETPPPTVQAAADETKPDRPAGGIPERLDGYEVGKELGKGGMGAVYLARQLSLDRKVALKVMNPQFATDPGFVARFTREAYAAAQLSHHNVVQIYDIGADRGFHFFSMEFVPGQSLAELAHKAKKVDPEVAAGYTLQAARGLKFGHDLGMVHRDVKPANLLVNDQGIVKVADLGLVKLPNLTDPSIAEQPPAGKASPPSAITPRAGASVTVAGTALGTPAYMAPEQARDASRADARSDVYSLGCTLYRLVAGQPPFEGNTVLEVITKHASEPVVPPESVAQRVPKSLSSIVMKMLAKKPEERYPDMGGVIEALEKFLGVSSTGTFSPREEDATTLETCVQRFNDAPLARMRRQAALGFLGVIVFLVAVSLMFGQFTLAGGFLGLGVLTPLCYFLINGYTQKTFLFQKARELVFGARWTDYLAWAGGFLFALLILYLLNLLWVWIAFCIGAAALAYGFYWIVDRPLAAQRAGAIAEAERLFRNLRLKGLDEETVRQFAYKYSGKRWEEFYEALFGYEAKMAAREWGRGELGKARDKFAAWREPVIAWIDTRQQARREARERKYLAAVEAKSLEAAGASAAEAKRQADQFAETLVDQAAQAKLAAARRELAELRSNMRDLMEAARRPETARRRARRRPRPLRTALNLVLGPRVRFLAGAALVAGCLLWVKQNDLMVSAKQLQESAQSLVETKDVGSVGEATDKLKSVVQGIHLPSRETEPLHLPGLPAWIADHFNSIGPGVAGLILLLAAFYRSWPLGALIWPAAIIAFAGPSLGVPAVGPLSAEHASVLGGIAIAAVGFVFLRRRW